MLNQDKAVPTGNALLNFVMSLWFLQELSSHNCSEMVLTHYFAFTPEEKLPELHGITKNLSDVFKYLVCIWTISDFFFRLIHQKVPCEVIPKNKTLKSSPIRQRTLWEKDNLIFSCLFLPFERRTFRKKNLIAPLYKPSLFLWDKWGWHIQRKQLWFVVLFY